MHVVCVCVHVCVYVCVCMCVCVRVFVSYMQILVGVHNIEVKGYYV